MSYSGRLFIVALGGCLVAWLALPQIPQGELDQSVPSEQQQQTGVKKDQSRGADVEPSGKQPTAEQNKTKAEIYKRACEKPKDSNDAQLCEQWRAAVAAEAQVSLNRLGTWFLFGTLIFTGIAAAATYLTVRTMKSTAERQLRAYLSVEITGFNFDRDPNRTLICKAGFNIRNDGQTPAYDVRTNVDFRVAEQPLMKDMERPKDNVLRYENSISPNRFQEAGGSKAIPVEKQRLLPGQKLYFIGLVLYKDAFDAERETWFCGYIDQSDLIMDLSPGPKTIPLTFRWAERHNKTT
ncbi:hypothetical protein HNR60_001230 [Rhodopseudomonas rhenobacensis]|uniref:Uncharacterized protein n=1 Tax=Rhodopseudomonas rhenobacensis TaxID=87461 RepID=A0A7W7Z2A8_9BRAD|nr:hypothetical protein [Rhodopseudomonas rhenobacensis]MBB5046485.1 hypothetical protein [Rhodopseudomonas rhenobacensis]